MKNTTIHKIGLVLGIILLSACSQQQERQDAEKTENRFDEGSKTEMKTVELPSIEKFNTQVAYAPSIGEGTISAIDLNNNTIKWTLQISEGQGDRKPESAMGIASTADGKLVFTGDVAKNEAVIVDAEQQVVIKRLPLEHGIHAIDISPNGHSVWVAGDLPDYPWLTATTVIDVEKLEKVTSLSPALGRAAHFAWTPDSKEVWVASVSTNTVWVWDALNKKVLAVIPLIEEDLHTSSPEAKFGLIGLNEIAITPDGKKAFAVGPEAGVVFAIDVNERIPLESVKVGERAHGVGVTRDGKEVWTANNTGTVTVLDVNSLEVLAQIDLSAYADELPFAHIGFSLDGEKAFVSIAKDIAVIDVGTREVLATIPFGYGTHEISLEDFFVKYEGSMTRKKKPGLNPQATSTAKDNLTRESERAGITISVTPKENEGELTFKVSMNTHAGDLMIHDLTKQSVLHLEDGSLTNGFQWEAKSESSHHREGILNIKTDGKNIRAYELEIKDIGVPSRKFRWNQPI